MSQLNRATIEAAAQGGTLERRNFYTALFENVQMLCAATGTNILAPTNSPQKPITPPPAKASLSVTGANGVFTVQIGNPSLGVNATIYHEVSYSPTAAFGTDVTVLPVSPSTHFTVQAPGMTAMQFRIRSSFDQATFNSYAPSSNGAVVAGLQSSAANSAATSLNQTNYATVDSVTDGSSVNVRVYGSAGPQTMWPGVKGSVATIYPSATIVNVSATVAPRAVVGYDGEQFLVKATLPEVFADEIVPVGQVGLASMTVPVLPTLIAVINGGYVQAPQITSAGSGLTAAPTLTVTDPTGAGAGAILQGIVSGGELTGVTVVNPGNGRYAATTTVTAAGGVSQGTTGGGTATGNNGGRLTALQS